jgi:hypothetical protein
MVSDASSRKFIPWFYAAAVYNAVWGIAVILFPNWFWQSIGMPLPNYPSLFQSIGMMVMVFGYGYWLMAKDPIRYCGYIWIALAGKTFGPIGFLYTALQGELPWAFGLLLVTNDVIWWPAFWAFALKFARRPLEPVADQPE